MVSFPQQITTELIITDPTTGDTVVQIGPGASIIVGPPPGGSGQIIIVPSQPEPVLEFSTQATFEANPPNMLGAADIIHNQLQLQLNSGNITAPNNGESSLQLFSPSSAPVGDAKAVLIASNATGSVSSAFTLNSAGANVDKPITQDTSWTSLAPFLQNGWIDNGSPESPVGFRLMSDGTVLFRGAIKSGTTTDGTLLFTLPTGYRPTARVNLIANGANNGTFVGLLINANGQAFCEGIGTNGAFMGFDITRFPVI